MCAHPIGTVGRRPRRGPDRPRADGEHTNGSRPLIGRARRLSRRRTDRKPPLNGGRRSPAGRSRCSTYRRALHRTKIRTGHTQAHSLQRTEVAPRGKVTRPLTGERSGHTTSPQPSAGRRLPWTSRDLLVAVSRRRSSPPGWTDSTRWRPRGRCLSALCALPAVPTCTRHGPRPQPGCAMG